MTAQPMPATGAAQPPAQPAPPATPTAQEARWAAHVAARRSAVRRRRRAALLRGVWGAVSVAALLVIVVYLLARLDVADMRTFAGAGVLAIVAAFVWAMAWSATHTRPAPPAQAAPEQWDLTPWTDIRPPGSRNTDTAMIDRENHVLMTVEQWRAQQRRPGDTGPLQR